MITIPLGNDAVILEEGILTCRAFFGILLLVIWWISTGNIHCQRVRSFFVSVETRVPCQDREARLHYSCSLFARCCASPMSCARSTCRQFDLLAASLAR